MQAFASTARERRPRTPRQFPSRIRSVLQEAVELEEELAFFQRLHNSRSWAVFGRGPGRHRFLLRRLGLQASEPTSIRRTVAHLADIVKLQQERAAAGPMGQRSAPPPVQAPPTLHPDPIMLSPLYEQPYLFVLLHQQTGTGAGDPASVAEISGRTEKNVEAVRSGIRRQRGGSSVGGGLLDGVSPHEAGHGLRAAYLRAYVDRSMADEAEELIGGPGVELWERLVGRLAARRAFQRAQLMLYWLQQELAFSEGCEDRLNWLSDVMVESDTDAPAELDWDFARCSRTLVALVVQLVDPSPAHAAVSGRYPPQGERMRPKDAEDMMYWIRYEVRSYPLDWSVGILFEMAGLSEEAQAVGRYHTEDIVLEVMRQLPDAVLLQVVRRLFLRLACYLLGSAKAYGVNRPGSLAAMVTAFRYGSVLLGLVLAQKSAADMLHDEFFTELVHLFRTPQVQERLAEVVSGQDAMLGQATQTMFEAALQRISECVPWQRGAGVAGEHGINGIGHLASRAGWRKMPALIT
ncbi:hypothetical protein HYH03_011926 [Edaphochlamys debaryana]|uniref:Uncharacterized protein n=1 Tax=Edaphochlamys debaryana TaxID=47281 RepID=A0A835XR71_9CHLO|nr:hypothetical protein HYH03_011926 [Edaphochlamys debaryana]|eukprot:KAG2489647.1 hypothetical protein HYH03_011926 [Edaphochlamys debaryana]